MDSRTRDETRAHNLSQPNEVSNTNAESKDNSNNDDKEVKNGATVGSIDQKFGKENKQESVAEEDANQEQYYTKKELMAMTNLELLKLHDNFLSEFQPATR